MNKDIPNFEVDLTEVFDKSVKHFVKKKKYTKLPEQLEELIEELENGHFTGDILTQNINPKYSLYKKRIPNKDTKSGVSNGYRVIYIVAYDKRAVGLLDIYYKKEDETLTERYIQGLVDGFLMLLLYGDSEE